MSSLSAGTWLGPYEILGLIGSGGMGEVYRARDTRLQRTVAIKVLPVALVGQPSRRARFIREAQAISQLSHPHICALFDIGESEGVPYIVMEFLDGETLEARLRRGSLPWATAIRWATEIASALDAAHRRGVIHRDLKPANIMVTESGVKLLDFGLARLVDDSEAGRQSGSTETLTAEQKIVGTLHYMSPEQLEGRDVDVRTDLFAFGVTLYEMVTGRKPFTGTSAASVTAAILTADPPPVSLSGESEGVATSSIDHVIRRALAKDPDERWQTARDLQLELRWTAEGRTPRSSETPTARRPGWAPAAAALVLAAGAGLTGWGIGRRNAPPPRQTSYMFRIAPPPGTEFNAGYGKLAVSRDGTKVAFVAGPSRDAMQIWWQSLDEVEPRPLAGTGDGQGLFWSADGSQIGYYANGSQLKRARIAGGTPGVVNEFDNQWLGATMAAAWFSDDSILFSKPGGLFRVPAGGGTPAKVAESGTLPRELPGGRYLYLLPKKSSPSLVMAGKGLAAPVTLPVDSNAAYDSGFLVYREREALVARPIDVQAGTFTGPPVTLAPSVAFNPGNGRTAFDVGGGVLVYRTAPARRLVWRDRRGATSGFMGEENRDWNPTIAQDGSVRIGIDRNDIDTDTLHIWTVGSEDGKSRQVTRSGRERFPAWSPDGEWIAYTSVTTQDIRRIRTSGSGGEQVLVSGQGRVTPVDYREDYLVYSAADGDDLFALPLADGVPAPGRPAIRLTNTPSVMETAARVSPDGRWIAYTAGAEGNTDVWLQPFPNGGTARRVSTGGGADPSWRADGRELFYADPSGAIMAVHCDPATGSSGTPEKLFSFTPAQPTPLHYYAATPDGQRFLLVETAGPPNALTVLVNWPARLH